MEKPKYEVAGTAIFVNRNKLTTKEVGKELNRLNEENLKLKEQLNSALQK